MSRVLGAIELDFVDGEMIFIRLSLGFPMFLLMSPPQLARRAGFTSRRKVSTYRSNLNFDEANGSSHRQFMF